MLKEVIGLVVAAGLVGVGTGEALQVSDGIKLGELLQAAGISEPVYRCAQGVLAGKDADSLVSLIEASATSGTADETPTQARLRECVMADPFGWAGTDQEWAIGLLNGGK